MLRLGKAVNRHNEKLERAKAEMLSAGSQVMKQDEQRDVDKAWKRANAQWPRQFVLNNYNALSDAFRSGCTQAITNKDSYHA